ncbi:MAG: molecular chaperone TorD family protein [Candidatus Omnitrophica bacterium]|nr:molecular chaperone TorD family protein [Candidatus Omnitrophota bacterium]
MSDPTNTKTLSEEMPGLLARSILYQALAYFFRHPGFSKDHASVRENSFIWREAVQALPFQDRQKLQKPLEDLLGMFLALDAREWAREYETCLGHTAHGMVPAYELEYGEAHHRREPQELADIAAFYGAFGLQVSSERRERADHAALECEFAHYLLYKEAHAIEKGLLEGASICREAFRSFFSSHLAYWFPGFALQLSKRADGFLKRTADFAFAFVSLEAASLGVALGPLDLPVRAGREREAAGCVSCPAGRGT